MPEAAPPDDRTTLYTALREFTGILEELRIEYFVVGSVAASAWGLGRTTRDVDLVVLLSGRTIHSLAARLLPDYYIDEMSALEALERGRGFNVIEQRTCYKFDLFPLSDSPFHQSEFSRRVWIDCPMPDGSSFPLAVSSADDTVLSKLAWYRDGGSISNQQWNDVQSIVSLSAPFLDRDYLRQWAEKLGVADLLEKLLAEAE